MPHSLLLSCPYKIATYMYTRIYKVTFVVVTLLHHFHHIVTTLFLKHVTTLFLKHVTTLFLKHVTTLLQGCDLVQGIFQVLIIMTYMGGSWSLYQGML